jgi:hypothetical protein
MMFCFHSWAFPQRKATFGKHRDVDVQTCAKCGARRLSIIQFGSSPPKQEAPGAPPQVGEGS